MEPISKLVLSKITFKELQKNAKKLVGPGHPTWRLQWRDVGTKQLPKVEIEARLGQVKYTVDESRLDLSIKSLKYN